MRLVCSCLLLFQLSPIPAAAQAVRVQSQASGVVLPVAGPAALPALDSGTRTSPLTGLPSSALSLTFGSALPGVLDAVYDGLPVRPAGAVVEEPPSGPKELPSGLDPARAPDPPAGQPAPPAPEPAGWKRSLRFTPHLLTGLNLASGLAAIVLAAAGSAVPAAGLIILANIFDLMDGRAARALGATSPMGIELDSLADIVSFGAAPAVLLWSAALSPLGGFGIAVASAYAFAGAWRLARFNLKAQNPKPHDPAVPAPDSFTGLPIPGGAGVVTAFVLALGLVPTAAAAPLAAVVGLIAAGAMVSTLPYPAFKKGGWRALALPVGVALAAAAPLAYLGLYQLVPAAVFGLYLLTGPARSGELGKRAVTGFLLSAAILSLVHAGGLAFALFAAGVAAMTLFEYGALLAGGGKPVHRWSVLAVGAGLALATVLGGPLAFLWPAAAGAVLLRELFAREHSLERAALTLFGTILLGGLLPHLALVRALPGGELLTYLLFASVWAMDTTAMFVGKAFGRHKLAPVVSPGKTWEGAIAGSAAALGVALAFHAVFPAALTFGAALGLGLVIGVFGPLSDLAKSVIKRSVGAKDSGNLLPGHGGFMDRFDSYILAAPLAYAFLRLLGY